MKIARHFKPGTVHEHRRVPKGRLRQSVSAARDLTLPALKYVEPPDYSQPSLRDDVELLLALNVSGS